MSNDPACLIRASRLLEDIAPIMRQHGYQPGGVRFDDGLNVRFVATQLGKGDDSGLDVLLHSADRIMALTQLEVT